MTSDLSLKDQIALAIEPWKDSSKKPSFTMEELAVLCLAAEYRHMSMTGIALWILDHCRWYRETAAIAVLVMGELPEEDLQHELYNALHHDSYEISIYGSDESSADPAGAWFTSIGEARCWLTPMMADLFPQCYPLETSETHFDFFKLPAELRNTIYDMVFSYPAGRLEVNRPSVDGASVTLHTYGEPYKSSSRVAMLLWMLNEGKHCTEDTMSYEFPFTSKLLESLSICRQFNQEASASFFGRNTFYANCLNSLHRMLSGLQPARRQLITSIAFAYWPDSRDTRIAGETFAMLTEMPRLRALRILIDENTWTRWKKRTGTRTYPDLKKLPGFPTLKTVRVRDEVIFYRTNDEAAEMLKAAMLSPQVEALEENRKSKRAKKGSAIAKQSD